MHDHTHDHTHTHTHESDTKSTPTKLILKYMLDHNIQHVKDAEEFATKLRESGNETAASLINDAISDYTKGNEKMSQALDALNEMEK